MRFFRFLHRDGREHLGVRAASAAYDLTLAAAQLLQEPLDCPTWFMQQNDGLQSAQRLLAYATEHQLTAPAEDDVQWAVPVRHVPNLWALAGNYRKHIVESGFADPFSGGAITPQVFMKPPATTLNAHRAPVYLQAANVFLDWEVELAVVIGKAGRDIAKEDAVSHVFGYSVINDISERKFNSTMVGRNVREFDKFFDWLMGKWFDGSAPLGPELVTADEVANPHALTITLDVNGQRMQHSNTAHMIFDIPAAIEYISQAATLQVGDVIAMGTPDGVGMARGVALKAGDRMSASIDGLGTLETPVLVRDASKG